MDRLILALTGMVNRCFKHRYKLLTFLQCVDFKETFSVIHTLLTRGVDKVVCEKLHVQRGMGIVL